MGLIKTPAAVQPAYNEIIFVDDSETRLDVKVNNVTTTLRRVLTGEGTRFDIKALLANVFRKGRTVIESQDDYIGEWAYDDSLLKLTYRVGGKNYVALNAVRQMGENVDLYDNRRSAVLTDCRHKPDGSLYQPIYEGFPYGVTVMGKRSYDFTLSQALDFTIAVPDTTLDFGFRLSGTAWVDWGDGSTVTRELSGQVSHEYTAAGNYVVKIQAAERTCSIFITDSTSETDSTNMVTSINKWGANFAQMRFAFCANLRSVPDEQIPAGLLTAADMFRGCSLLTTVPAGMFSLCNTLVSADYIFFGSGLTAVPDNLFAGCTGLRSVSYAFMGTLITSVGNNVFGSCYTITNMWNTFAACVSLTSIPEGLLYECTGLIDIRALFMGSTLSEIPSTLFRYNANLRILLFTFSGAPIVTVPAGVFDSQSRVTNFTGCFQYCNNLITLPDSLFSNCTAVSAFDSCFSNCTSLSVAPYNMFGNSTVRCTMSYCFQDCTSLPNCPRIGNGGVPGVGRNVTSTAGMFQGSGVTFVDAAYCQGLTSLTNMNSMFYNCTSLNAIGDYAFAGAENATDMSNMFYGCTMLTSVNNTIFGVKNNVDTMVGIFRQSGLISIPANIFDGIRITGAQYPTTAQYFFYDCPKLTTIDPHAFDGWGTKSLNSCFGTSPVSRFPAGMLKDMPDLLYCRSLITSRSPLTVEVGAFESGSVQEFNSALGAMRGDVTILGDVFVNCPDVRSVSSCFGNIYGDTSTRRIIWNNDTIENNLFYSMPNLEDVSACFEYGTFKTVPDWLFSANKKLRRVNQLFFSCRYVTSDTPADPPPAGSTTPIQLWQRTAANGYTPPEAFQQCFANSNFTNYASIPANWK